MIYKRELLFSSVCGLLALFAFLGLSSLVAEPKLLFGRSLSAITPTLFPQYILLSIVVLSVILMLMSAWMLWNTVRVPTGTVESSPDSDQNVAKKIGFFVLLICYGLMLKPFGFLISSALVITGTSLLLGNRSSIQIALLALVSPVCLYLIATRAMLVSLPELNPIELFYSQVFNWFQDS